MALSFFYIRGIHYYSERTWAIYALYGGKQKWRHLGLWLFSLTQQRAHSDGKAEWMLRCPWVVSWLQLSGHLESLFSPLPSTHTHMLFLPITPYPTSRPRAINWWDVETWIMNSWMINLRKAQYLCRFKRSGKSQHYVNVAFILQQNINTCGKKYCKLCLPLMICRKVVQKEVNFF